MSVTNIEWTDRVWNPVTGCRKVSPGCKHCYAEGVAHRFWNHQYVHTVERGFIPAKAYANAQRMTGTLRTFTDVMTHEDRLLEPLRWKKPTRVFVNSMSDLFHEDVPDTFIDQVFAVMHLAHQHTFQVLTKRPERMQAYLCDPARPAAIDVQLLALVGRANRSAPCVGQPHLAASPYWPLPNVWLGVSVEDQERANERIPLLLQTPAAVRFISAEPLLGPVNLQLEWLAPFVDVDPSLQRTPRLDWVIVGGESGPGARPCHEAWVRSIVQQCQAAGVPAFVKQLGAFPIWSLVDGRQANGEGGTAAAARTAAGALNPKCADPSEWPDALRVREFPR